MPPQTVAKPRLSLDIMSGWALIATIVLALVIVIPSASIPFAATKTFVLAGGALITLALFILARLSRGNVILPPTMLVAAFWLPALAYLLSTLFSGAASSNAIWGSALEPDTLAFMLVAAALGTLAALVMRRAEHFRTFLTSMAWLAGLLAVVQILILVVGQFAPNTVSPAFSLVGSSSDLAMVMGLSVIGVLLALRFLDIRGRSRTLLLVTGVLALILLAVFNVSLVWVLVALAALGLFVEAVMKRSPSSADADLDDTAVVSEAGGESDSGSRSLVMPLVVLAISIFFLIGGTLSGALANGLHVNVISVRPSWGSTLAVGSRVYGNSPFFGSGPGTFGTEWLKYRDATLNSTVFWNVDFNSGIGALPTSFVTTGILGALAWIALFALLILYGVRTLILRSTNDPFLRFVSVFSFVAVVYLFVSAVFGLPSSAVLALAFVFAGLFASALRFAPGREQWGVVFARAPRVGFVIVFALTLLLLASVVAGYSLVGRYVANVDLARAAASYGAGDYAGAFTAAQDSLSFASTASAYQMQAGIALGQLQQIAASSTMPAADAQKAFQATLSTGINAALTATQVAPNDYQNWIALGNLYAQAVPLNVSGAYDSAKTAYQKAQALNPTNPQIPYILAQLDIAHKDTKSAEADLKQAISLKQDYTAAIFLLSQLYVQDGNVKDALASAEAAAYFTPNDASVLFQVGVLRAANNDFAGAAQALSAAVAANPQFANARYFLAAVYAKQNDLKDATAQIQAIADLSADNAKAVETQLSSLQAGKNPFPSNLFSASSTPPSVATATH